MNQAKLKLMLEEAGIPVSIQRLLILEMLMDKPGHFRAEEIYEALKPSVATLSKSTVYNTLHLFSEKGILHALNLEEGVTHYDPILEEHAHFVCDKCMQITNVELPEEKKPISIPGARVESREVIYRGICKDCMKKNEEKNG